eukprot:COSAG06_NODE_14786_length_1126_cov_1.259981_1_plen_100_part_10
MLMRRTAQASGVRAWTLDLLVLVHVFAIAPCKPRELLHFFRHNKWPVAAAYPFALPALASTAVSAGGSAEAVAWAKKGLAWLFSYHHEEATVAFNASRAA